jgi:hypothetical protein
MDNKARDWLADVDKIRRILMTEWDPIGCGVPDDEYDSYIPKIYQLIQKQVSVDDLARHLTGLVTASMGLAAQHHRDRRIAENLLKLML